MAEIIFPWKIETALMVCIFPPNITLFSMHVEFTIVSNSLDIPSMQTRATLATRTHVIDVDFQCYDI